jgi:hypothetical protein
MSTMLSTWKQAVLPTLLCLLVGASLLSSACSLFSSAPPPLSDSTFSRVLVDIHLLSARRDLARPLPQGLRDSLLTHHGIRREDFNSTLRYYARHPNDFSLLYNAVIDTLKAVGSRRRTPSGVPSHLPDSVRRNLPDSVRQNMSGEALPKTQ